MSRLNTRNTEGAKAFYGAVLGWETDTSEMGAGEITLWRVLGYVGGSPSSRFTAGVVGVMVRMSGIVSSPTRHRTGASTSGSMRPTQSPFGRSN